MTKDTQAQEKTKSPIIVMRSAISFEVYPHDAPKIMTWVEATDWAKSVGDGWRLPTREELLLMYEQRDDIGGFVTASGSDIAHWYWSCTEPRDDASYVYVVDFTDGDDYWNLKDYFRLSSRLVRAELPDEGC